MDPCGVRRRTPSRFAEQLAPLRDWYLSDHSREHSPDDRQHPSPVACALLALALGGFAIGTTEFVTMGLLPDIADGIDRVDPDDRPHHHGVRLRGRRRRARHRVARRAAAQAGAGDRPDPGAGHRQRDHGGGERLPAGHGSLASSRVSRTAPTSASRRCWPLHSYVRSSRPRRQLGHARPVGCDGRRRAGQHVLGQQLGWRSAYWVVLGDRDRDRGDDLRVRAALAGQPRRHAARRALGAEAPAGPVRGVGRAWSASAGCSRCTATSRRSSPRSRTCRDALDHRGSCWCSASARSSARGLAGILADWDIERSVLLGFAAHRRRARRVLLRRPAPRCRR